MTCSESYLTYLDRSEWERGICSTSVDYKWTSVTALSSLSIKYFYVITFRYLQIPPRALCLSVKNIMQTYCCADMDLSYHSPIWFFKRLLVYWDAGLLVSSCSPCCELAAAPAAEYHWVPVHLIELYVSPSPTLGGGLSFNCCNLISIRLPLSKTM